MAEPLVPLIATGALSSVQMQRAIGALLGAASADALGAPFEFGPGGRWSERFPTPEVGGRGEMIGGGAFGWAPGEFTDDTQMALALAESIVEHRGIEPDDLWRRWRAWAATAADIGTTTSAALAHPTWNDAAERSHRATGRGASNGALMRVSPVGIVGTVIDARQATQITMRAAIEQAGLTHHDPDAAWGSAIAAELVRRTILGADPIEQIDDVVTHVPRVHRSTWAALLSPAWEPDVGDAPPNGTVWGCLAQAVWAIRHHRSFAGAVTAAIDLGGDTDTVACVAGAIAGARAGIQEIPSRWSTYVHGRLDTPDGRVTYDSTALQSLVRRLVAAPEPPMAPDEASLGPVEVADGVIAANLTGAADHVRGRDDVAVLSLCRTAGRFRHVPVRREAYLVDQVGLANPSLGDVVTDAVDTIDAWLDEGRTVVVHCHSGRSRTALVLEAWAMRRFGWSADEAESWLADRWAHRDPWNETFREFLRNGWQGSSR